MRNRVFLLGRSPLCVFVESRAYLGILRKLPEAPLPPPSTSSSSSSSPTEHTTLHTLSTTSCITERRADRGNERETERGDREGEVKGSEWEQGDGTYNRCWGREKQGDIWGSASSGGVILETNQWLIHSWGLVGPELFLLGCLLAGSSPEECTGACLWKAEAMTSSSLTVAQLFEFEEKGDGAGMREEAHNSFFSSVLSCAVFFVSPSLSLSPAFCPSLSPPLALHHSAFPSLPPSLPLPCPSHFTHSTSASVSAWRFWRGWFPQNPTCLGRWDKT